MKHPDLQGDLLLLLLPPEVHQAAGMISVQLGMPVDKALIYLCLYAIDHALDVADVADEVIGRELRFVRSPPPLCP